MRSIRPKVGLTWLKRPGSAADPDQFPGIADPDQHLRKMEVIFRLVVVLFLFTGCASDGPEDEMTEWTDATETYTGTVKGVEMTFQHKDTLQFRLNVAGEVIEGELDTEKGFGGDAGALVYILNIDRPEAEQAYFVKFSTGEFRMLDQYHRPIERSHFKPR